MPVTAGALPDVEGRAPVSVTGETPVLHVLEPVAKASLTDILGDPIYRVVVKRPLPIFSGIQFTVLLFFMRLSRTAVILINQVSRA